MIEFLNNPWVTGIGGGIISSLIVFFVTRYLFNKKENKEYNQKIQTANNEILYSLRPLIIEKSIPSSQILSAIRVSIAQKYSVKQEDLYNEISLYNDLVTEIMSTPFLSSEQKLDYCASLQQIRTKETDKIEYIYIPEKTNLNSKFYSSVLAIISFSMVITMTLIITEKVEPHTYTIFEDNISLVLSSIIVPIIALAVTLELFLLRNKMNRKQKNPEEKDRK